uniref:Tectonic domain-containing protein n=1 Tax=Ciona intestinalis TaxID=7719 RepID=F6PTF9_CIOIN
CTCDLTGGVCEVNCCCDVDCTSADIATFSRCIDTSYVLNNQKCVVDQVVFVNSISSTVQTHQNGLFCIETDNFAERNNYINPLCATSNTCFNFYTPTFTYETSATATTLSTTAYYTSGDTIDTIYTGNVTGLFKIPVPSVSNLCQESSPVEYLINQRGSCVQSIIDLSIECTTNPSLSASSYFAGFKIAPTRSAFLLAINSSIFDDPSLLDINETCIGVTSNCSSLPSYDTGLLQCLNAVTSAQYSFTVNGTGGITAVDVTITLANLASTSLPLAQDFGVSFASLTTSSTVTTARSGNPGYIVGKPVISALYEAVNQTVSMSSDPNVGFTLVQPDSTGLCSNVARTPILFGQDLSTGCRITYTSSTPCDDIQQLALRVLNRATFTTNSNLYVAAFGNSDIQSLIQDITTQDWVLVQETAPGALTGTVANGCNGILLGAHYQILYANAGSISNPQAKIIGVRYSYDTSQTLTFVCLSPNCDTRTQSIEIKNSVTFLDVSETPTTIFKQRPTIQAKLPNDFFFPFKNSATSNLSLNKLFLTLLIRVVCKILVA